MICKLPADKKILAVILALLGVLIVAVALTSCGLYYDETTDNTPRQPVNEKVFPIYNKAHLSAGEFLIEVGKNIEHKIAYHNWRVYDIEVSMGRSMTGKPEIKIVWVYYD
jgi:hypothetical protein